MLNQLQLDSVLVSGNWERLLMGVGTLACEFWGSHSQPLTLHLMAYFLGLLSFVWFMAPFHPPLQAVTGVSAESGGITGTELGQL